MLDISATDNYTASLTGEPFLFNETKTMAEYYLQGATIDELRHRNLTENLIRYKSPKAIQRVNTPIFRRIKVMSQDMLEAFANSNAMIGKTILLCAIMKTDRLVRDFIRDLYYEKLVLGKDCVEQYEINNWFEQKIANSEKLSKVSQKTQYKLRQVMTKIMKDSGLYTEENSKYRVNILAESDTLRKLFTGTEDEEYFKLLGGKI